MEYDLSLSPNTGWGTEERQLRDRGYGPNQAVDRVVLKYLGLGDPRPLLDLLWRVGGVTLGSDVLRYIAAMIDPEFCERLPNGPPQYEIRFAPRGRPKQYKQYKINFADFGPLLKADTMAMAGGHQPDDRFWVCLRNCLSATEDPTQLLKFLGKDIPVAAKIVRIDGKSGRHCDPELEMRDTVLNEFVHEDMKRLDTDNTRASIRNTRKMIEKHAEDGSWHRTVGKKPTKTISEKTIEGAFKRKQRSK